MRSRFAPLRWLFLVVFCAPRCVEESESSAGSDAGANGDPLSTSIGESGAAGESFGPTRICGKRTMVSDCDPLDDRACESGLVCNHVAEHGGFKCYEDAEPAGAGEPCDGRAVKCAQGLFCETYALMACQHYCCLDSDCEVGVCYGGYHEDGEATIGRCFDEYGGLCLFADPMDPPEECLNTVGAGGGPP